MATCTSPLADTADSDYGSDLDSELVIQVLSQLEAAPVASLAWQSLEDDVPHSATVRLPAQASTRLPPSTFARSSPPIETSYYTGPGRIAREGSYVERLSVDPEQHDASRTDNRSPLQRFRTLPMKPLSVTDIVSPAWCEIQYWYTLTKYGRKRRTPAMRQGSKVHKELEDQVHTKVEVIVQTREDAWGLKIWNIIQGLRTLRKTGHTRELEIWGVIDGQVINGIIDELSYSCPDESLEKLAIARLNKSQPQSSTQTSIPQFFKAQEVTQLEASGWIGEAHPPKKVWITDVKTRGNRILPQGSSMRPTVMQLMIYRKLLADLATDQVDAEVVFKRYRLNPNENFTDAFVAEVGDVGYDFRERSSDDREASFSSQTEAVSELFAHNTLTKLWRLMIQEFGKTISGPSSIGQVLRAEFRQQQTGEILGSKTLVYDEGSLNSYIADEMKWWRGERKAKGVDIEEAFKCRICEFAEDCEWRKEKVEEATANNRKKRASRTKSAV
ncbi:Defects-in-morphology protein 1-like mitochondrial [Macrophomina phaseolina MS6]|uniref:Defects-in-morphology protein 1-like mitochondrial n=1 Tax=Macrophomina phaseolina (strain MS6) TaxID=1126212 RepID=K2R5L9_MACPH|nr:Defects-in-morphology protein 1-like mitochondrial [Macrophomina phaseolina MS6]